MVCLLRVKDPDKEAGQVQRQIHAWVRSRLQQFVSARCPCDKYILLRWVYLKHMP